MSIGQIGQVLDQIRALQGRNMNATAAPMTASMTAPRATDFASMLKNSVDHIATMDSKATALADSYEAGDKSVDLTKVMLEVQKASLAFHAMTEVRNKLVDAYQQVMNMSV